MFQYSNLTCLAAGGGGDYSLFVGEDFIKGTCGISATYENEMLSEQNFKVKQFEVWGIE